MGYVYFDGALIEESRATLSIHNVGVQRGFGVFDLFRVRNGKPTFMQDHLDRFDRSQRALGLDRLITMDEIRDAVQGLQEWNGYTEATFKLMLLGDGQDRDDQYHPLFYIIHSPLEDHYLPASSALITHEYLREMPEIKSVNYLTSNTLHVKKRRAGAVDVAYYSGRVISEASRSNLFMVRDGILFTPSSNILEGVTRKQILSFSDGILPTEESTISVDQFISADEVFISSTLKEILPITAVDGKKIGDGKVGPYTKKLQKGFRDLLF